MERKIGKAGIMIAVLLMSMALMANLTTVKASGTIYIRADGSIDPSTAPISTVDNITYTFTANIYNSIVVERDSIIVDGQGYTIQGPGIGTGIDSSYRSNVAIKNMEIKVFGYGIDLLHSSYNSIAGNDITNNGEGIRLAHSSNNIISGNTITANNYWGILLGWSSNYNSASGNTITANKYDGIALTESSNNIISGNTITANNQYGISLGGSSNIISGNTITANNFGGIALSSSNNVIYHNDFIDNAKQAQPSGSVNVWDDGYPSGGNYWSDYTGVDIKKGENQDQPGSDGMGDTPYVINANNRDRYPLMNPYGSPPPTTYTLTITTTAGGTTNPAPGTYTYSQGQTVPVQATPNTGYVFHHWELDSVNGGSSNPISVTMNSNHNLKAYFSATYTVTINAHCNTEGADVSVSITMDGSPTGYNTPHTFTGLTGTHTFTVPNTDPSGHSFKQWGTGETSTTITVTSGGTCMAYYQAKYTLNIITTVGGTTNPTAGIYSYWPGTIANVTAIPNTEYCFDHWELDGSNLGSINPISVTMDSNHNLRTVFSPAYSVTIKAHCITEYADIGVTITMDGSPTGYTTPHTFTGLTRTHTFTVPTSDPNGHPFKQWSTGETSTTITVTAGGTCMAYYRTPSVHAVAITDIKLSKTIVGQNYSLDINVTAVNPGDYTETFNVTIYANTTFVALQTITLEIGASTTVTFTWNTTGFAKGNYTISAIADIVPDETDTADNTFVDGWVKVVTPGNVNGDEIVDMKDITIILRAYGTIPGHPNYNANADVNCDGIVDMKDITITLRNYGQTEENP